jgi:putative ABC transport system permease protein
MLRNYLRTSFRYLSKNKVYTTINVLGLAVGLTCFMLLTIFVRQEFSYDEFHSKKDLIYQVFLADSAQNPDQYKGATQGPAGPLLAREVPEIVNYARIYKERQKVIKVADQRFIANKVVYADRQIFQMLDFPLLTGQPDELSLDLGEMVISESQAIRLFGSVEKAIGQSVEMVDVGALLITDVFKELPENTHLDFDFVISFEGVQKPFEGWGDKSVFEWGFISVFRLYVELAEPVVATASVEKKIEEALNPHQSQYAKLLSLPEIYFSDLNTYGKKGNRQYMQLYLGVAFLILIVASVNYMNLSTARLNKRSKEVGIRKTVGGNRSQIVRQFLVESLMISVSAMVLAVCLAEFSLPFMSQLIDKPIDINYQDPTILGFMSFSAVFVGLVSGLYPALYLSRFKPVQILSGKRSGSGQRFSFRQILVGFQFFTCLGLMTVTLIVFQQFKHMQLLDNGVNDEQVVSVVLRDEGLKKNYAAFKEELKRNPEVQEVTGASHHVFTQKGTFYVQPEGTTERQPVTLMTVESNFIANLGINIVEGADFNQRDEVLNSKSILINESARDKFDWESPIGKKILSYHVVGVTDDFIYTDARVAIEPLMIIPKAEGFEHAYIRLSTPNMSQALTKIEQVFDKFSESYPFEYSFLNEDFVAKYEKEQRLSQVFTAFSILAIFVAGLGILGLSIYIAEQRTKEIGIRRVLGAKIGSIIWLLNRNTTLLIALVAAVTLPVVHLVMRAWVDGFTNQINLDIALYLIPLAGLIGMIWLILLSQSIKSARQNPVHALRTE